MTCLGYTFTKKERSRKDMNEIIKNINARRSVRFYDEREIPTDTLKTIIAAGHAAPSGMNAQQWRFVVVTDASARANLAALAKTRYKTWLANAPEDFKAIRAEVDALVSDPVYYNAPAIVFVIGKGMTAPLDCPMVCQNMMLAARSFDIGSCWVYFGQLVLDDEAVRRELEIQEDESVFGPILLGYPKDGFPEAPEKKALSVKWI